MKVLAISGGGIRGMLPAIWAKRRNYTSESFDLIAGTSTGSIIGAAIARGMEPAEIEALYRDKGRAIFPGFFAKAVSRIGRTFTQGLSAPLYSNQPLIDALKEEFGETLMGELRTRFMAVTYNYSQARPKVWKSWDPEDLNVPVWKVVAASCAAPVYFSSVEIGGEWFGDGGTTGANNPSLVAIAEASKLAPGHLRDVSCVCLGTGIDIRIYRGTESFGPVQWATDIIQLMLDAPEQVVTHVSEQMIGNRYEYLNVPIDAAHASMDDASQGNLDYLTALANSIPV